MTRTRALATMAGTLLSLVIAFALSPTSIAAPAQDEETTSTPLTIPSPEESTTTTIPSTTTSEATPTTTTTTTTTTAPPTTPAPTTTVTPTTRPPTTTTAPPSAPSTAPTTTIFVEEGRVATQDSPDLSGVMTIWVASIVISLGILGYSWWTNRA